MSGDKKRTREAVMISIRKKNSGILAAILLLLFFLFAGSALAGKANTKTVDGVKITFATDPSPPKAGNNIFRVSLKDRKGKPIQDSKVRIKWMMPEMPDMGVKKADAVLTKSKDYAAAAELGMGGIWKVTVSAAMADSKVIEADFELKIQ